MDDIFRMIFTFLFFLIMFFASSYYLKKDKLKKEFVNEQDYNLHYIFNLKFKIGKGLSIFAMALIFLKAIWNFFIK